MTIGELCAIVVPIVFTAAAYFYLLAERRKLHREQQIKPH